MREKGYIKTWFYIVH